MFSIMFPICISMTTKFMFDSRGAFISREVGRLLGVLIASVMVYFTYNKY